MIQLQRRRLPDNGDDEWEFHQDPHEQCREKGPGNGKEGIEVQNERHHRPVPEALWIKPKHGRLRRRGVSDVGIQTIGKGIARRKGDRGGSRTVSRIDKTWVDLCCKERC